LRLSTTRCEVFILTPCPLSAERDAFDRTDCGGEGEDL